MVSSRAAHVVGRGLQRIAEWFLRLIRRPRELGWDEAVVRLRDQTRDVMRTGWLPMTLGTLGYIVVYFVLFWVCLRDRRPGGRRRRRCSPRSPSAGC